MEIRFEKRDSARNRGTAGASASGDGRRRVTFRPAEGETKRPKAAPAARETGRENAPRGLGIEIGRYGIMASLFIFAGMILFMLSGYEKISRSYQEINVINAEIEETKLNINALEVAIECAVTIEQAQAWAKSHNMQYPLQSQYVVSGSSIPVSRGGSSASSGTGAGGAGTAAPAPTGGE